MISNSGKVFLRIRLIGPRCKILILRKKERKNIQQRPSVEIEPTTTWLKATRSTTELGRPDEMFSRVHVLSEQSVLG